MPDSLKLLIIGGSGFVSGTLVHLARAQGHHVWTLTRGQHPLPDGVTPLIADRKDRAAFARALAAAHQRWDLVVDCIAYDADDVHQDLAEFANCADHLVFISTDFVYDPRHRRFPQAEESDHYLDGGYGGHKRQAELVLTQAGTGDLRWTILRPCHIYGPGSKLGCLPLHSRDPRLIERLRDDQALGLVGGGHFLQQPLLAMDLCRTILSCAGNAHTYGSLFSVAGPEIVESRTYYQIVADILGEKLRIKEVPVSDQLASHPESAPFLCHRIYDLSKLQRSGAAVPATPLVDGLRSHVESLLHESHDVA